MKERLDEKERPSFRVDFSRAEPSMLRLKETIHFIPQSITELLDRLHISTDPKEF